MGMVSAPSKRVGEFFVSAACSRARTGKKNVISVRFFGRQGTHNTLSPRVSCHFGVFFDELFKSCARRVSKSPMFSSISSAWFRCLRTTCHLVVPPSWVCSSPQTTARVDCNLRRKGKRTLLVVCVSDSVEGHQQRRCATTQGIFRGRHVCWTVRYLSMKKYLRFRSNRVRNMAPSGPPNSVRNTPRGLDSSRRLHLRPSINPSQAWSTRKAGV